jgi:hypothetical protein
MPDWEAFVATHDVPDFAERIEQDLTKQNTPHVTGAVQ